MPNIRNIKHKNNLEYKKFIKSWNILILMEFYKFSV